MSQSAKSGLRAFVNKTIWLQQRDGAIKQVARDFGKSRGHGGVLRGDIVHLGIGNVPPLFDGEFAEVAIAIVDHQRLGRRLGDVEDAVHKDFASDAAMSGRLTLHDLDIAAAGFEREQLAAAVEFSGEGVLLRLGRFGDRQT